LSRDRSQGVDSLVIRKREKHALHERKWHLEKIKVVPIERKDSIFKTVKGGQKYAKGVEVICGGLHNSRRATLSWVLAHLIANLAGYVL
jgi:hypothetical protein